MGYKIIALIGKAGSGKDTILNKVLDINPTFHKIINSTTRETREGEVEGINYYFLTIDQYTDKLLNNEFVEASYKNWFYGTTYEALRSDCINIGVFNPDSIILPFSINIVGTPEINLRKIILLVVTIAII